MPESGFRLLVLTAGAIAIMEAPVTLQDKLLDWPARMLAGDARKEPMLGAAMTDPPPPPPGTDPVVDRDRVCPGKRPGQNRSLARGNGSWGSGECANNGRGIGTGNGERGRDSDGSRTSCRESRVGIGRRRRALGGLTLRSEEHTSELQSLR